MGSFTAFQMLLVATALVCCVDFGYVLLFDIVIMPGLATLDDGPYLLSFQAIDGVIQRGQPLFGITWMGSVIGMIAVCVMSYKIHFQERGDRTWFARGSLFWR